MAWAIAVCIDLTCVMAARERQRDRRTGRRAGRLTWPTLVLAGGVLLSLAANLAQAERTAWGWLTAATPGGAFLVAVSMLERRAAGQRSQDPPSSVPVTVSSSPVPPSFGQRQNETADEGPRQAELAPVPGQHPAVSSAPADSLVAYARRVAE